MLRFIATKHYAVLFLISTFFAFTPFKLVAILPILFFITYLIPFSQSIFVKFTGASFFLFAANTVVGGLLYFLHVPFELKYVLIAYNIIVWLLIRNYKISFKSSVFKPSPIDLILAVSLVIPILYLNSIFKNGEFYAYRVLTYGGDNISHIELINAVRNQKGYYYKDAPESSAKLTKNLAAYPQGFHLNFIIAAELVHPVKDVFSSNRSLVYSYMTYFLFVYAGLGIVICGAVLSLFRSKTSITTTLFIVLSQLALLSGVLFPLYSMGFATQVACLSLFVLFYTILRRIKEGGTGNLYILAATLILLAGISFTWLFLLPVALILAFVYIFFELRLSGIKKFIDWRTTPGLLALGCTCAIQPIVQVLLANKGSGSALNEIGYTSRISIYAIIILVATTAFSLYASKKQPDRRYSVLALLVLLLFSLAIGAYNIATVHTPRYYYFKSLYTLLIFCVIILTYAAGSYIDASLKKLPNMTKLASIVLAAICLLSVVHHNLTDKFDTYRMHLDGGMSKELSETVMGTALSRAGGDSERVLAIGSCNRQHDYVATRLVGILGDNNGNPRQALLQSMLEIDKDSLKQAIVTYQSIIDKELILVSTDRELQKYIMESTPHLNSQYIDIDLGQGPKNRLECPELVK